MYKVFENIFRGGGRSPVRLLSIDMIERDYIMRQIHQLAQVLAQLMGLSSAQRESDGEALLSAVLQGITGTDLQGLRSATDSEVESLCSPQGVFSPELAAGLADALMEDSRLQDEQGHVETSTLSKVRALWLYRRVREEGGAVPMSVLSLLSP